MPKTRIQKQEVLRSVEEKIKRSKSVIFASFNALGVKENEALRKNLSKAGSEYLVAKKTLLNIAFKDRNIQDLDIRSFDGKVAAVFGYEDEVAPAKVIHDFKKGSEDKIAFVGGVLDGKYLSKEQVGALALLPSKNELYAKIVGSLNAPISGFVNVLAGNLRGLVNVLKAIEEKKA